MNADSTREAISRSVVVQRRELAYRAMVAFVLAAVGAVLTAGGCGRSLQGTYVHSTETMFGTLEETLEFRKDGTFILGPDNTVGTYEIKGSDIILYREILGSTVASKGTIAGDAITVEGLLGGLTTFTKREARVVQGPPPPRERIQALFIREYSGEGSEPMIGGIIELREDGTVVFQHPTNGQASGTYKVTGHTVAFSFGQEAATVGAPQAATFDAEGLTVDDGMLRQTYKLTLAQPPEERFTATYVNSFYEPSSLSTVENALEFASDGTVTEGNYTGTYEIDGYSVTMHFPNTLFGDKTGTFDGEALIVHGGWGPSIYRRAP